MSTTPCGCECKTTETATASEGFAFVPLSSHAPAPEEILAVSLALMATVALTLAHQRRRSWCVLALRDSAPAPRPAAAPWWKLRPSPAERRFASSVMARTHGCLAALTDAVAWRKARNLRAVRA